MTRPDYSLVLAALSTRLAATSGLPTIAYANVDAAPPTTAPYVTEDFAPATLAVKAFGRPDKAVIATGLYAIGIYGLPGKDAGPNLAIATALVAQFAGWTSALSNGDLLRIRSDILPTPGGSRRTDDGWWFTPVNVFWSLEARVTIGA